MTRRTLRIAVGGVLAVLLVVMAMPENAVIPVASATARDWNQKSFWYEPWGASEVHKGIDIFAPSGTAVVAPVSGLVVFRGVLGIGGNAVAILGPKWRIHYFAHLASSQVRPLSYLSKGRVIGAVGTTGNSAGKAPHLHYAVLSLLPRPWGMSKETQGWKRMFFVDPNVVLGTA